MKGMKSKKAVSLLLTAALILTTGVSGNTAQAAKKGKKQTAKVSSVKITNSGKKLRLQKGKKFRLKTSVKVKPNKSNYKKLKFTSSNRKVVLVNSKGLLKGVKEGTARITAASKTDPKKKASITVSVTKDVLVTSIQLDKTKITVDEFNQEEISLKVKKILPANAKNKKVKWSTSDEDVADVNDDGMVTTGDVGSAVIKAEAADQGGACATCTVVVLENENNGEDAGTDGGEGKEATQAPAVPGETASVMPKPDDVPDGPSVPDVSEGPSETEKPVETSYEPQGTDLPTAMPGDETENPTMAPGDETAVPTMAATRKPSMTSGPTKTLRPAPTVKPEMKDFDVLDEASVLPKGDASETMKVVSNADTFTLANGELKGTFDDKNISIVLDLGREVDVSAYGGVEIKGVIPGQLGLEFYGPGLDMAQTKDNGADKDWWETVSGKTYPFYIGSCAWRYEKGGMNYLKAVENGATKWSDTKVAPTEEVQRFSLNSLAYNSTGDWSRIRYVIVKSNKDPLLSEIGRFDKNNVTKDRTPFTYRITGLKFLAEGIVDARGEGHYIIDTRTPAEISGNVKSYYVDAVTAEKPADKRDTAMNLSDFKYICVKVKDTKNVKAGIVADGKTLADAVTIGEETGDGDRTVYFRMDAEANRELLKAVDAISVEVDAGGAVIGLSGTKGEIGYEKGITKVDVIPSGDGLYKSTIVTLEEYGSEKEDWAVAVPTASSKPNPWDSYQKPGCAEMVVLKYNDQVKSGENPNGGKIEYSDKFNFKDGEGYPEGGIDVMKYDRVIVRMAATSEIEGDGSWYGKIGLNSSDSDYTGLGAYDDGFGNPKYMNDVPYDNGYVVTFEIPHDIDKEIWAPEEVSKYCDAISLRLANGDEYEKLTLKEIVFESDKKVEPTKDPYVPQGKGWQRLDLSTWSGGPSSRPENYLETGEQIVMSDVELETIPIPTSLENIGDKIEVLIRGSVPEGSDGFRYWLANEGGNTLTTMGHYSNFGEGVEDPRNADNSKADLDVSAFKPGQFQIQRVLEHINKDNSDDIIATSLLLRGPSYGATLDGIIITGIWVRYGDDIGTEGVYEGTDISWIDPMKPMVAFTFDDGPIGNEETDNSMLIHKVLKEHGAHATFFYIGSRAANSDKAKDEIKQAAEAGFEVGNHSYDWSSLAKASQEKIEESIDKTNEILTEMTGYHNFLFRAPNLATSATMRECINAPFVHCGVDSKDWNGATTEQIIENVKKAKDGDIILMHETEKNTVEAVPELLDYFQEKGWQVVSVSELFLARGKAMSAGQDHFSCPPSEETETPKPTRTPRPTPTVKPQPTPDSYVPKGNGWQKLDLSVWSGGSDNYLETGGQIVLSEVEFETIPLPQLLENIGDKIEVLIRGSVPEGSDGFRYWLANEGNAVMTTLGHYSYFGEGVEDPRNADDPKADLDVSAFKSGQFQIQRVLEHINRDYSDDIIATKLLLKGPSYGTTLDGIIITGIWVRYGDDIGTAGDGSDTIEEPNIDEYKADFEKGYRQDPMDDVNPTVVNGVITADFTGGYEGFHYILPDEVATRNAKFKYVTVTYKNPGDELDFYLYNGDTDLKNPDISPACTTRQKNDEAGQLEKTDEEKTVTFSWDGNTIRGFYVFSWAKETKLEITSIVFSENEPEKAPEEMPEETNNYAQQVLELVNVERAKEGLEPLTLDETLCAAADVRAQETTQEFSHTRPDGTDCFTILKEFDVQYHTTGENIAAGYPTAADVVEGWMNSPGHRANILKPTFRMLGVGFATAETSYRYYWTQLFTG